MTLCEFFTIPCIIFINLVLIGTFVSLVCILLVFKVIIWWLEYNLKKEYKNDTV